MAVDLLFFQPLDTSHPVDLVFGLEAAPADGTTISLIVALQVSASFVLDSAELLTFNIALAPPALSVVLQYDNAVSRRVESSAGGAWGAATSTRRQVAVPYREATARRADRAPQWADAARLPAETRADWQANTSMPMQRSAVFCRATQRASAPVPAPWAEMQRHVRPQARTGWQVATQRPSAPAEAPWQERLRTARPAKVAPWGEGTAFQASLAAPAGQGWAVYASDAAPWQRGRQPAPGRHVIVIPEPPTHEPCYTPPAGLAVELLFDQRWDGSPDLFFICKRNNLPPGVVVVPVRRVYMVTNSVSLIRTSDGTPVKSDAFSATLDIDSWAWGFNLALPATELGLVEPTLAGPVELLASINGMQFRLLAEQVSRERSFGSASVRVQGRGRIAELDAPYAAIQSFGNEAARTAQQLMADVLTDNGVSMGWAVDWSIDDWLVPAGAWSHQGTRISALNAIAKSAGAYLQPHASAQSLKVLHRYPVAPWDWADATPDLVLPADLARRESKAWEAKPAYNRVFIAPQQNLQGYQVTRAGTAGDMVAPLIVDALMTEAPAVRQRARAELGQGGRQVMVGLGLPVLPETGVILPGTFLRYEDGADTVHGIVRSTAVEGVFPNVWQSIGVETRV